MTNKIIINYTTMHYLLEKAHTTDSGWDIKSDSPNDVIIKLVSLKPLIMVSDWSYHQKQKLKSDQDQVCQANTVYGLE